MELFYTPRTSVAGGGLVIAGEEAAHIVTVLRRREGDALAVTDGEGALYDAVIVRATRTEVRCSVRGTRAGGGEPSRRVVLAASLLRNPGRFEMLVEKAVELGVAAVQPIVAERTVPRHGRRERWEKIALAAMKQSCRTRLPRVEEPADFRALLASPWEEGTLRLIAHEQESRTTLPAAAPPGGGGMAVIAVGPEGGFSPDELAAAAAAGYVAVGLGPRRLRAETAAILAVGLLTFP